MNNIILNQVSKIIIPLIQIFGLYIIFFGHLSPGGGFAGGTIIGSSFILMRIVHKKSAKNSLTYRNMIKLLCSSLIIYGLIKGYSFITGGSHICLFKIPLGTPGNVFSGGLLLPLNICVGITVSIVMYFFFSLFYEGDI